MPKVIEQLVIELRSTFDKLSSDMDGAASTLKGFEKKFSVLGKGLGAALGVGLGAAAIVAAKKMGEAIIDLAARGEEVGSISSAFEKLGGSTAQIDAAKNATLGLVKAVDLQRIANEGMLKVGPQFAQNLALISDVAARTADALGMDTTQAVDTLTNAILRGNTKTLASFGVLVKKGASYEEIIKAVGEAQGKLAPVSDSVTNALDALSNTFSDITDKVAISVNENPALAETLREIGETAKGIDFAILAEALGLLLKVGVGAIDMLIELGKWLGDLVSDIIESETVKDTINSIGETWKLFWMGFDEGIKIISRGWEDFWGDFDRGVQVVGDGISQTTGFFKDMYDKVVGNSYVPDLVREVGQWFDLLPDRMAKPTAKATDRVNQSFLDLGETVSGQALHIIDALQRVFGTKSETVSSIVEFISLMRDVIDIVKSAIEVFNSLSGIDLGSFGGAVGDIFGGGGIVGDIIGGAGDVFDSINPFALGGVVTGPTLGLVGEAGPEAILPLNTAGMHAASQIFGFGSGGTQQIVLHIDARGAGAGVEYAIERAIERATPDIVEQSMAALHRQYQMIRGHNG